MNIVFQIDGGIGKSIAATAVCCVFTTPAVKKASLFYSVPSLKKEGSFIFIF
jgi:hypothetical protein